MDEHALPLLQLVLAQVQLAPEALGDGDPAAVVAGLELEARHKKTPASKAAILAPSGLHDFGVARSRAEECASRPPAALQSL